MYESTGVTTNVYLHSNNASYFLKRVGFGSDSVHSSAQVDVVSTSTGLGLPSMTTAQKAAIGSPRAGLMVYDNTISQVSYYNGVTWVNI